MLTSDNTFDAYLITNKPAAREADLCDACLGRRLVTKMISGIRDKETDETFSDIAVTRLAKSHGTMQIGRICKARPNLLKMQ